MVFFSHAEYIKLQIRVAFILREHAPSTKVKPLRTIFSYVCQFFYVKYFEREELKSKKDNPKSIRGGKRKRPRFLSHGILLGPASSSGLILDLVCLAHMSNFRHKGVIRIWIR